MPSEPTHQIVMKPKPLCQSVRTWLRENLGKHALAPLTSADFLALDAAIHIAEMEAYHRGSKPLAEAFGNVVRTMQKSCYRFAYHAIAHVQEWNDRGRLWNAAGLPDCNPGLCDHEPAARGF
jgi:hypothetical protein